MRLPRDLSGAELVQGLTRSWGYRQIHQVGSHVILETDDPSHQRLTVPNHRTLRVGTLNAILRSVARHKGVTRNALASSLRR